MKVQSEKKIQIKKTKSAKNKFQKTKKFKKPKKYQISKNRKITKIKPKINKISKNQLTSITISKTEQSIPEQCSKHSQTPLP